MTRAVALSTLRDDVRAKADIGSATVRHSDAQLTRLINQSIQMFRERISDEGSTHYLVSSSGTLGSAPTSPYAFYQLDLSGVSPALVRVYGIDVTFDGGHVVTLDRVPFEARNDYGTAQQGGVPRAWAPFKTDQIAILPASNTALPYTVWYLPKFTDLSADADTFDGVAGWEEWIVWDVVAQIAIRDQNPQALQVAEVRRQEVEQRVVRGATKVTQAGGAHVGRDSFGGKLTHFLGGRRQTPAVAGGPYVPASSSVTNAMLAKMTGPTVKGVPSGETNPIDWAVPSLTTYLSTFSTLQRGLVPPPLATSNLFLRDDGTWAAGGGGAGNSVGPSGAVQYQAGTGMAGASGFRIHGLSGPSLIAHLDGTLKVTGGQVEVGSGTVRVSASGVDVGGGSVINVGTLVASSIAGPAFTSTTAGLAPLSGGGTSNFLRADGVWTTPPAGGGGGPTMLAGGTAGSIQYNSGSGLKGTVANSLRIAELNGSGVALAAGATVPSSGVFRFGNGTDIQGQTASGTAQALWTWRTAGGVAGHSGAGIFYGTASGDLQTQIFRTSPSGVMHWHIGPTGASMHLTATGLDARNFHVAARSLSVSSGIPNTELSPMASGTIKGQLDADGIPQDIPLASVTAALYHFDSANRGVVPGSGGGTSNFLRADGTWASPPGGSASPSGAAFSVQFQNNGSFGGATGIAIVGSGTSLRFGGAAAAATGYIAWPGTSRDGIYGRSNDGAQDLPVLRYPLTGVNIDTIGLGGSGIRSILYHGGRVGAGAHRWSFDGFTDALVFDLPSTQPRLTLDGLGVFDALNLASGLSNAHLHPMGSGTVKGNLGATGAPTDVPIATLFAFVPTFTSTQRGVVPPSDGLATSYLAGNGTWTAPSGAHQFPPAAGATNAQLAVMSTGTVKANLSGNATPSDVPLATLLAFAPTFTDARMGVVPASGGGTSNFLRADGTWGVPPGAAGSPGGAIGNVQFNTGASSFGGATGVSIVASGQALAFGVPSFFPGAGDLRVASGFNITANLPSGIGGVAARQTLFDWSGGGASGVLKVGGASGILGTNRHEVATGGAHEWLIGGQTGASLRATGADFSQFHIRAKSLDVFHINGLPTDANQLKRGINIGAGGGTGIPSGLHLYVPGPVSSGANRYIIPSGFSTVTNNIILNPTGARGGNSIRIERLDPAGALNIVTPTGTILHTMPSGRKYVADFVFTKPSGTAFEHGGSGDLF